MSDFGRETRAYVSGYDRSRVHQSRLYRFSRRQFIANFNGALPPERLIQCVTWRTDAPEIGIISDLLISADRRETTVLFASQLGGWANMRCDATLDNGEIYTQVFRVNVREASYFFDDPPTQPGPFSLTVCVEPPPPTPPIAEFTSGNGESLRGYGSPLTDDPAGELISTTFDDPSLEGIGSNNGIGLPVVLSLGSQSPIPVDIYASVVVYDDLEAVFWSGNLADADVTSESQVGAVWVRFWQWNGQGNPFNGTLGQQFRIEAQP